MTLRTTRDRATLDAWSLVLQAGGIPHRVVETGADFRLDVDWSQRDRAEAELASYEAETTPRASHRPAAPVYGRTGGGVVCAAGLVACFAVTGPYGAEARFAAGAADAERILAGELWRALTALTLHADAAHLVSNVAASALFASLLFYTLGPGLGGVLMLGAGAAGNLANAWLRGPGHVSVGFSTAVFAAIGLLCGLQAARRWRARPLRRGAWLSLAAGLALLGMLGTAGERTDLSAHLLGLASGALLGAATGSVLGRPPVPALQALLAAIALTALAAAWSRALVSIV